MLLICIHLANVLCAWVFKPKCIKPPNNDYNARQSYNFVDSVRSSALSAVPLIAFISVFSAVTGIIKGYVNSPLASGVLIALTEVTSACDHFANFISEAPLFSISMIGFSLGFGGISVLFQAAAFATAHGLKMRKYLEIKLTSGLVSAMLSAFGYTLFFGI